MTRAPLTRLLAALALGLLAACSSGTPPASTSAPADAPAATPATPAAAASGSAPAPASAETAKGEPAATEDSALEKAAPLAGAGQLPAGKWVAGKNYTPISPAQATDAAPGKVEVLEVFWYACPHCYALDPLVESWRKTKPDYIDFKRVPVTWQEIHRMHGQLFYTLQALGKEEALHAQVFDLMHTDQATGKQANLLYAQGNANETFSAMQRWARSAGIAEQDFANAWKSFGVAGNMTRASDIVTRYRVDGVPMFIVNGKYSFDEGMAGSPANVINLINDLARSERPR